MSERVLVRKIEENLWQWREVSSQGTWRAEAYYTGDINLLKETAKGKVVWLILPGQDIVAQQVITEIKDRSQLLKILPYEIEENVVGAIEDMHFAYGELKDEIISVAYGDLDWLQACIEEIEATEAEVFLCSADYLQLPRDDDSWTLLLENGILMAHIKDGEGFAIEQEMAGLYLECLASETPKAIKLYGDDEESLYSLHKLLPEAITSIKDLQVTEDQGGLWDIISPSAPFKLNFRSGKLSRKLPFAQWWADYKTPIVTLAAAFLLAVTSAWFGQSKVTAERKILMAQTDDIYRQVVPSGKITEPSRQLRALLGNDGPSSSEPTNAVSLITGVGPAISGVKEIQVKSFRYNVSKRELQMNVEGKSYENFEALRSKISEAGLEVSIKNQSAHGDVFQAQMNISEAS